MSTIEITALKTTYRSMITASTDIGRFIIQLGTLMAAEKNSETDSRTRHVTGDDENYHDYWPQLFCPANERNRIPFPQVNGTRSSVGEPTIYGAILPLSRQYEAPKDNCESAHRVYLQL